MHAFWSGLVAGYGIAVPVGAVGTYLVTLTARAGFRTGAAAALGVASADGVFALLAVLGGTALAGVLAGVAGPLRWVAFGVLLVLAVRIAVTGLRHHRVAPEPDPQPEPAATHPHSAESALGDAETPSSRRFGTPEPGRVGAKGQPSPARAYLMLLGTTLLNPATVVYFAALVVAGGGEVGSSRAAGALFVAGALLASASWQLLLALAGSGLGRLVTGARGRLGMALVSAALIAGLAVSTVAGS